MYQHDFFVSYSHIPGVNLLSEFVAELVREIRYQRVGDRLDEPVYLDRQRLQPGFVWKSELSRALCHSRCMLAIYTDDYFSRDYCIRKWDAMVTLETQRIGGTSRRMIIPILLRCANDQGEPALPARMRELQYEDFRSIVAPKQQFATIKTKNKVATLLRRIDDLKRRSKDPSVDCDSFEAFLVSTPQPAPAEAFGGSWG
ncbi:MAG TPA: toll/interleukin-1 receptor domain-containing protein [Thermoanaerobaculia bacterium]|nr:toll/interleukin-1 receptor domain-containing protein [Thermoanaerobaculia bacterium]